MTVMNYLVCMIKDYFFLRRDGWIIESFFGDVEYLELRVGCTN
jgi:hypothetical protein